VNVPTEISHEGQVRLSSAASRAILRGRANYAEIALALEEHNKTGSRMGCPWLEGLIEADYLE
jgi:hypothetical protein